MNRFQPPTTPPPNSGHGKMGGGADEEPRPPHTDGEEDAAAAAAAALTPWEQHSAVISIPRFDYRAPSSLLHSSRSGFLVTCPIKREKSATKEVISILQQYVCCMLGNKSETPGQSDTNDTAKKRKLCLEEIDASDSENAETKEAAGKVERNVINGNAEPSPLSLVKLTKSGLLLLTFTSNNSLCTVGTLSKILHSLGSGSLKPPLWCHRIFPIQETCMLIEKDLQRVVSKLTHEYLGSGKNSLERSIKFAVGFNRRGIDETQVKSPTTSSEGSNGSLLLDRAKCFQVVAGAVKAVAINSSVDLTSPEIVVLVEWLPVAGLLNGSAVVGVSLLPSDLVVTKPRLLVKPLVSEAKAAKKS